MPSGSMLEERRDCSHEWSQWELYEPKNNFAKKIFPNVIHEERTCIKCHVVQLKEI